MKKIVIAVDSFKGSLASAEIAEAVGDAIYIVLPDAHIVKVPIADGGEGTVDALIAASGGTPVSLTVSNPLMQPVEATYGLLDNETAIIEMAAASGLSLIPWKEGNVMHATSYGTGELIVDAIRRGCRSIMLGIGGSATNDAGVGMLQALGFQFVDKDGKEVGKGGACLSSITSVRMDTVLPELKSCRFQLAVDVDTPFCGPAGATMIFAPQKGATATDLNVLEKGMQHFAALFSSDVKNIETIPGTGAGGGMAGGCLVFLNAELIPGIEMVKQYLRFDELIQGADLIITGEGRIDQQTLYGKTPLGVMQSAKRQHIPVVAMTGQLLLSREECQRAGFDAVYTINPPDMPLSEAMQSERAFCHISDTVRQLIRELLAGMS